jgi:Tfp pilus assembly protein PilX
MRNPAALIKSEEGSVMVVALIVLAMLTIIGISASNTSTTELQIVRNDLLYRINFYKAEAAAREGAQTVANLAKTSPAEINPGQTSKSWLVDPAADGIDMTTIADVQAVAEPSNVVADAATAYAAAYLGRTGSVAAENESHVYHFNLYGLHADDDGRAFIEMGYKVKVFQN